MSKLLFLGTGADDWDITDKANGFFRRKSAALLNDDLMIDCGPYVFDYAEDSGDAQLYTKVTDVLITHPHDDHYNRESILRLAENQKIRLACDSIVRKDVGEHENIEYVSLLPYQVNKIGAYEVIPVFANHQMICDALGRAYHYIIRTQDGKSVFYGLDGAWFLCPSWEEMLKHKYDVMVLDCTVGDFHDWRIFEHNTIPMLRDMVEEIKANDLLTENGCIIASHLAKTLHKPHEETKECLAEFGMLTAFDGMEIGF